jgi:hypothetical protein
MRIISKFRDYYDCIQSYGQDDLTYIREKREVEIPFGTDFSSYNYSFSYDYYMSSEIIGFCGKLYPLINIERYGDIKRCYTVEDIDKVAESVLNQQEKYNYYNLPHPKYRVSGNRVTPRATFVYIFDKFKEAKWPHTQLFDQYNVPIFSAQRKDYRTSIVTLNDCLRPFEFVKVLDPYQAFQELSMYLANIARPMKPIPKIDDKTLAEAKGYDKFSFRKPRR